MDAVTQFKIAGVGHLTLAIDSLAQAAMCFAYAHCHATLVKVERLQSRVVRLRNATKAGMKQAANIENFMIPTTPSTNKHRNKNV